MEIKYNWINKKIEGELFKKISEYDFYYISNKGRVYNKYYERFLTPSKTKEGYLRICLTLDSKSKTFLIHRLVAEYFCDKKENMNIIHHIDNNKENNMSDNLIWCNQSYNVKMAYKDGLFKKVNRIGKNNPNYRHGKYQKIF